MSKIEPLDKIKMFLMSFFNVLCKVLLSILWLKWSLCTRLESTHWNLWCLKSSDAVFCPYLREDKSLVCMPSASFCVERVQAIRFDKLKVYLGTESELCKKCLSWGKLKFNVYLEFSVAHAHLVHIYNAAIVAKQWCKWNWMVFLRIVQKYLHTTKQ